MPTGYTCYIEDGKIDNAKDFLMVCARAFGACIEMRDEPFSTPIPEKFESHMYYKQELEHAQRDLEKFKNMSIAEAQKVVDAEYENRICECKKNIDKEKDIGDRYAKVLDQIKNWTPPTSEHSGLKDFAVEQITMCMSDVLDNYYTREMKKPKQEASEWLNNQIENCQDNIKRYTKEWDEEVKRTNQRNEWLQDLRDSLNNM